MRSHSVLSYIYIYESGIFLKVLWGDCPPSSQNVAPSLCVTRWEWPPTWTSCSEDFSLILILQRPCLKMDGRLKWGFSWQMHLLWDPNWNNHSYYNERPFLFYKYGQPLYGLSILISISSTYQCEKSLSAKPFLSTWTMDRAKEFTLFLGLCAC